MSWPKNWSTCKVMWRNLLLPCWIHQCQRPSTEQNFVALYSSRVKNLWRDMNPWKGPNLHRLQCMTCTPLLHIYTTKCKTSGDWLSSSTLKNTTPVIYVTMDVETNSIYIPSISGSYYHDIRFSLSSSHLHWKLCVEEHPTLTMYSYSVPCFLECQYASPEFVASTNIRWERCISM